MPRILSRRANLNFVRSGHCYRYQRDDHDPVQSEGTSESTFSNASIQSWLFFVGGHSPTSSLDSSANNSVSSSRRSSFSSTQPQRLSCCNESQEDSSWGQFIDTAEAEAEIIRHSRILSRRQSLY